MANIQLQIQNIIRLAEVANTQLVKIETTILQVSKIYKIQMAGDIFSISEDLQNIIQGDIKNQVYYIQALLADELDKCKEKGNTQADNYIKIIQKAYQDTHYDTLQPMIVDKGKQKEDRVQDKEIFLYKPYDILLELSKPKMPKLIFFQDEVNNLEKYIKLL